MEISQLILIAYIFSLSTFVGVEIINKVPPTLHTPLMSASNAISGIAVLGAISMAGLKTSNNIPEILGFIAIVFATINVVGGYSVTNRMLAMFKTNKKNGK